MYNFVYTDDLLTVYPPRSSTVHIPIILFLSTLSSPSSFPVSSGGTILVRGVQYHGLACLLMFLLLCIPRY